MSVVSQDALAWLATRINEGWRFRLNPANPQQVQFSHKSKADEQALQAMRVQLRRIGESAVIGAFLSREQARQMTEGTLRLYRPQLALVAHELTELDRHRMAHFEAQAAKAIEMGDATSALAAAEQWVWAAHPLRWLPHGSALLQPAVQGDPHARWLLALYDQQRIARKHQVGSWSLWPAACVADECRGICAPPSRRHFVVPASGDPTACVNHWDWIWEQAACGGPAYPATSGQSGGRAA